MSAIDDTSQDLDFELVTKPIALLPDGRVWSQVLNMELGVWRGECKDHERLWRRFFRPDGSMIPPDGSKVPVDEWDEWERREKEAALDRSEGAAGEASGPTDKMT